MDETTVSVAINRKIALPNYENVDIKMEIHNVEVGATEAEVEEALATGDLAITVLKKHLAVQIRDLKAREGSLE